MAASDHLQLKMFMTADELVDSLTMTSDMPTRSVDHVLDFKAAEAKSGSKDNALRSTRRGETSLYDSIKKDGVRHPVQLIHTDENLVLGQGHHRVAVAHELSYQDGKDRFIPVVHTDATSGSGLEGADDWHDPVRRRRALTYGNPYGPTGPMRHQEED
jgi:hypothetical protein